VINSNLGQSCTV